MSIIQNFFAGCRPGDCHVPAWALELKEMLGKIIHKQELMMATLDDVLNKVTEQDTALDSIRTLIGGLRTQLAEALANANLSPANQAKVDAVFTALEKNSAEIVEALADNVPPPA